MELGMDEVIDRRMDFFYFGNASVGPTRRINNAI